MIILKSKSEIELMREAGKIVAETHEVVREAIIPGISTLELDKIAEENIRKYNAVPSFTISLPGIPCTTLLFIEAHILPGNPP